MDLAFPGDGPLEHSHQSSWLPRQFFSNRPREDVPYHVSPWISMATERRAEDERELSFTACTAWRKQAGGMLEEAKKKEIADAEEHGCRHGRGVATAETWHGARPVLFLHCTHGPLLSSPGSTKRNRRRSRDDIRRICILDGGNGDASHGHRNHNAPRKAEPGRTAQL